VLGRGGEVAVKRKREKKTAKREASVLLLVKKIGGLKKNMDGQTGGGRGERGQKERGQATGGKAEADGQRDGLACKRKKGLRLAKRGNGIRGERQRRGKSPHPMRIKGSLTLKEELDFPKKARENCRSNNTGATGEKKRESACREKTVARTKVLPSREPRKYKERPGNRSARKNQNVSVIGRSKT